MNSRFAALTTALALALAAPQAFAEAYKVNFHIGPGVGADVSKAGFITGADMKLDLGFLSLGPVVPQLEGFGLGTSDNSLLAHGGLFGGGIGLRWRILNDEKGYYFNPGGAAHGNLAGNLWVDAHLAASNGGPRIGFDVGVGYELSVVDGLQVGPYAKFSWLNEGLLMFGITFSIGGPATHAAEPEKAKPNDATTPPAATPSAAPASPAPETVTPAPAPAPAPESAPAPAPAPQPAPQPK